MNVENSDPTERGNTDRVSSVLCVAGFFLFVLFFKSVMTSLPVYRMFVSKFLFPCFFLSFVLEHHTLLKSRNLHLNFFCMTPRASEPQTLTTLKIRKKKKKKQIWSLKCTWEMQTYFPQMHKIRSKNLQTTS